VLNISLAILFCHSKNHSHGIQKNIALFCSVVLMHTRYSPAGFTIVVYQPGQTMDGCLASWQSGKLTKRIITADKAGRHSIRYGNKVLKLFLKKGGNTIQHLL